jgi:nuclear transport factor 2 (NTF2) superfamily protein
MLLKAVTEMFQGGDIQALADLFTEDCAIRYGAAPEQQGRIALRRLITELLSRRQNLQVQKTCVAIDRNKLTIRSEERWTERDVGTAMTGFGVEVWTMREGKIAIWEAAFSAGEEEELLLPAAA